MRQKFYEVALPMEESGFTEFNGAYIDEGAQEAFASAGPFR
jgi:hypothetical protein